MPFQPQTNDPLTVDDVTYRLARHPAAPGMPYGQEGRQATVYQLAADGQIRALKVFKARYRIPALAALADRLVAFADLPGLAVCRRTVLTARRHTTLLRQYPDLTYAVLMPWIAGPTSMETLLGGQSIPPEDSLALAHALAETLAALEERGVAHCDLSGPNLLLPTLDAVGGARRVAVDGDQNAAIELVDVEQLYGPGLERPQTVPAGSPGYAHRSASVGLWGPDADRFAGAVLLAEILSWCDARVRAAAWGESYFDPAEMQQPSDHYSLLLNALTNLWGGPIAALLEQAWGSATLADCPTFGEWLVSLPAQVPPLTLPTPQPAQITSQAAPATGSTEVVHTLVDFGKELERAGNRTGALRAYQRGLELTPDDSAVAAQLKAAIHSMDPAKAVPSTLLAARTATAIPNVQLPTLDDQSDGPPVAGINLSPTKYDALQHGRQVAQALRAGGVYKSANHIPVKRKADVSLMGLTDLQDLFNNALLERRYGNLAHARVLLRNIIDQDPNYTSGGSSAKGVLADLEHQINKSNDNRDGYITLLVIFLAVAAMIAFALLLR